MKPASRSAVLQNVAEVFENPQIESRNMKLRVQHPKLGELPLTGNPIKLSEAGERDHAPPPMLGEHTESVLRERLGIDNETLRSLRGERRLRDMMLKKRPARHGYCQRENSVSQW